MLGSGKVRALAVTTARRSFIIPAVPTLHQSGLTGYDRSGWQGLLAPAAVPKEIVARLNQVIAKMAATSEAREWFNAQGFEPQTNTPDQFAAFIRNDVAQNLKLIKSAGIKI